MKSRLYLSLLVISILALFVIGCGEKSDQTEVPSNENVEEATETAVDEVVQTFETLKENYLTEAENIISEWDTKLSDLTEKKNALPELASKPLEEPYNAVMAKKADVDTKLNDLKEANEEAFTEKKDAFEGSLNELKSGYESILSKF